MQATLGQTRIRDAARSFPDLWRHDRFLRLGDGMTAVTTGIMDGPHNDAATRFSLYAVMKVATGTMDGPHNDAECAFCQSRAKKTDGILDESDAAVAALIMQDVIREAERAKLEDEIAKLEDERAKLKADIIRYKRIYRKLKAQARRRERRRD